jgi:hypothetical protein
MRPPAVQNDISLNSTFVTTNVAAVIDASPVLTRTRLLKDIPTWDNSADEVTRSTSATLAACSPSSYPVIPVFATPCTRNF